MARANAGFVNPVRDAMAVEGRFPRDPRERDAWRARGVAFALALAAATALAGCAAPAGDADGRTEVPAARLLPECATGERPAHRGYALAETGSNGRVRIHSGIASSDAVSLATIQEVRRDAWEFDPSTGCWEAVGEAPWMVWGFAYDRTSDTYVGYDFLLTEDVPAFFAAQIAQPVSEVWTKRAGAGWERTLAPEILARNGPSMAYDPGTDRVVMFGGCYGTFLRCFDETWTYDADTGTWTEMAPAQRPPGRDWAGMEYHAGLERIVLFGGHHTGEHGVLARFGDTWLYDPASDAWTELKTVASPPPRAYVQMAYAEATDRVYVFGGSGADRFLADLWYLDAANATWVEVDATGPAARGYHAMGYDATAGALVVFGGGDTQDLPYWDDTWVFDLEAARWTTPDPDVGRATDDRSLPASGSGPIP